VAGTLAEFRGQYACNLLDADLWRDRGDRSAGGPAARRSL
jgi:hypothetical protein